MSRKRQIHFNLNFMNAGSYSSAWRWPENNPTDFIDPKYFVAIARLAERGTFDAIFLADHPALSENPEFRPFNSLEPTILLATMAAATEHIGLIATLSTSYNEPYNVARRFASIDHVSGGRSGWNIVTTAEVHSARNFGLSAVTAHAERYARAKEFADVVVALWDSWEDEAFVGNKNTARFVDRSRVHAIDHKGERFSVKGPLNIPRSPQGRPITVQAGGSKDGLELAARHAELVFSVAHTLQEAIDYKRQLDSALRQAGRAEGSVVICPGLVTILGGTEAEARQREQELWESVPIEYGLGRLANTLHVDPSRLKLDEPLPSDVVFPEDHSQTFFRNAISLAERGNLTVRQLIKTLGGGGTQHRLFVGTPEQLAADIESWFETGAIGGFNIMPDVTPTGLAAFVDHVVPILRRRGIFRSSYEGSTLRDHLGLARPLNRHTDREQSAVA